MPEKNGLRGQVRHFLLNLVVMRIKGQLAMAIMTIEGCAVADGGIVSVLHVIHRRVVMTYGVKLFKLILVLMM